ncbi:DUF1552 domain-containing protein [Archangium violaceum]|uniref:DUF1552 domain-containing protein n=1 Tax=Archangium violaceum TaxID=83451 RepID=UPI00194ED00C|nr:DUF1552 domain-containing protein [Archangium violaceum]QRN99529.1 DUF1552 domain-containing protein [Archangium violaceum]
MLTNLSRRSILQALAGTALAAPFGAKAQTQTPPLRFIALFTPHGTVPEYWAPRGGETDFDISYPNSILAPLDKHRSKLLILDGLDYRVLYEHGTMGHEGAPVTFLTGSKVLMKGGEEFPEGISLDQELAQAAHIGGATRFRSMNLNAWEGGLSPQSKYNSISFASNAARMPFELNPFDVYTRLFGDMADPGDPEAARRALARRRSLVDFLTKDASRLRGRLGTDERQKLDSHLQALRDMEKRLESSGLAGCSKPVWDPAHDYNQYEITELDLYPTLVQLHMQLIARAFACDLTRVVTLFMAGPPMPWLDINEDVHHNIAHMLDSGDASQREATRLRMVKVQLWYTRQVAYLMDQLAAVPEGNGTALDNTVILWGNELANPAGHTGVGVPIVLAGGAGGRFRMGRYLRLRPGVDPLSTWTGSGILQGAVAHNKLLVSIANAFGLPKRTTFGHPDYIGELPGLV